MLRSITQVFMCCALVSAIAAPRAWADTAVALAPLETLGAETRAARATQALVARALAAVPGYEVVPAREVRRALARAPRLRTCDGDAACLARLGAAVGAGYVVSGEVGGLGAAEVVYLELVDAARRREVRATTLELGDRDDRPAARAAAYRLLAPERYVGTLVTEVDVDGASIYVDGAMMGTSPSPPIELPVGTHALRVTHPEFRDVVRFVDIEFGRATEVEAGMRAFPVVASDLAQDPGAADPRVIYRGQETRPWYRSGYVAAGIGTAALVTSAVIVGLWVHGIDADREEVIDPPR